MTKNVFSFIVATVICFLLHLSDPGDGNLEGADFIGLAVFFAIAFFISRWIFDRLQVSESNKSVNSEDQIQVKNDLQKYNQSKEAFRYFSSEKLKEMYDNRQQSKVDKMELLALEETLVERGVLDHSPIREQIFQMQKYFDSLKE